MSVDIDVNQVTGKYRRRMLAALAQRSYGLTTQELFDTVYFDDPNGGPETLKIFSVMKNAINKQIRRQGFVVESELGVGSRFKLMLISEGRRFRKARAMRVFRRKRKL